MPSPKGKKPANRKTRPRGAKKRHYFDCARKLFCQFSYAATSLEQIAEAAGVTRSVLARSFPTKAAFLQAVGDDWLEMLYPSELADDYPSDVIARLQGLTERFLAVFRNDPATAEIILSGLAEPIEEEESTILHAILNQAVEKMLPIIVEGQQAGVIRRGIDPQQTAADWMRFLLGAALLPLSEPKEGDAPTQIIENVAARGDEDGCVNNGVRVVFLRANQFVKVRNSQLQGVSLCGRRSTRLAMGKPCCYWNQRKRGAISYPRRSIPSS